MDKRLQDRAQTLDTKARMPGQGLIAQAFLRDKEVVDEDTGGFPTEPVVAIGGWRTASSGSALRLVLIGDRSFWR